MSNSKQKKILILEDEKPMAQALELKLQHAGFDTKIACNGEEGLDCILKDNYDLILCDLVVPKIDGFGVLQTLKDKGVSTPVIVLSNLSQEEDEKKAKELGAKEFFIKSNTPLMTIVEKIENFLK